MKSILIQPKSSSEYKLLLQVLEKMGVSSAIISSEEMEDALLSALMQKVDRTDKADKEEVGTILLN